MYYLSILAIFKNEGHIINEWIYHHILEGVEHFYLIDNGSNDNYIIDDTYHNLIDFYITQPINGKQIEYYNYFLDRVKKETKWLMVIDLDEFVYSRLQFNTITEYLQTIDNSINNSIHNLIDTISIPWKLFGSSGYVYQPNTVIPHFVFRSKAENKIEIKSIIRTDRLISIGVHNHNTINNNTLLPDNSIRNSYYAFLDNTEEILNISPLHLNHYPIQSFEYFKNIKMTRGDVINSNLNYIRNIDYFNNYDKNCNYLDTELKYKHNNSCNITLLPDIKLYGNIKYIIFNDSIDTEIKKIIDEKIENTNKYIIERHRNKLKVDII